jgi:hypothetical protein
MGSAKVPRLTVGTLKKAARDYVEAVGVAPIPALFGVTDGKAVGTYVEHGFNEYLQGAYLYVPGNSAMGIDFPDLRVDLKVTSIRQPQSSSPFRDATQKVYGLGYSLLVMVYEKTDDHGLRAATLDFQHVIFIESERTADFQTTSGLCGILDRGANSDDVEAFLVERNLPLDDIGRSQLAERILKERPLIGHLTISNALQWRLQYGRAITLSRDAEANGLEDLIG